MSNCRSRASAVCGALVFLAMLPQVNAAAPTIALSGERRLSFNDGWRFYKGEAAGAEKPEFDDSAWRPVRLPHDWAIEGPFDSTLNPQTGALPMFGTGWYRKSFALPAGAKGKYFSIEFDGAMSNSKVWLNGHELGGRPYGSIGFRLDLQESGGDERVLASSGAQRVDDGGCGPGPGDVGHGQRQGHRHQLIGLRHGLRAGVVSHVGVARAIHHDLGANLHQAALGGDRYSGDAVAFDNRIHRAQVDEIPGADFVERVEDGDFQVLDVAPHLVLAQRYGLFAIGSELLNQQFVY